MGLGHIRAAFPLRFLSGGEIIVYGSRFNTFGKENLINTLLFLKNVKKGGIIMANSAVRLFCRTTCSMVSRSGKTFIFLMALLVIACLFSGHLLADDWQLKMKKDGITVYTRNVKGSGFKEFKATAEIKASLESALKLITDVKSYAKWSPNIKEIRVLKKINSNESIMYEYQHVSFLVADRDCVYKVIRTEDKKTKCVTLTVTAFPEYIPVRKGVVRVKTVEASWTLTPHQDTGTVTMIYQMHNEPGGKIPKWLANAFVVKQPYKNFVNMRKLLQNS
ncbi:MAG: START domain-containing protein [Elusimicrobia bacterium]|nr:START domain-containing protein [Elusimicrobiota bacterium]